MGIPAAVWLFRRTIARSSLDFRLKYEDEMVDSLERLLADERRRRGRLAALTLWIRAMADGASVARTERARPAPGSGGIWNGMGRDVRYVWRSWRSSKIFAVTAIVTITLGVGLNAALFAFADGFLFRPLPFDDPDALFEIGERGTISGGVSLDDYEVLTTHLAEAGLVGLADWSLTARIQQRDVAIGDRWEQVRVFDASPRFTEIMGFRLARGRPFQPEDHQPGSPVVCWVTDRFWRTRLGGEANIIGQRLKLAGVAEIEMQVVGILPSTLSTFDLNNAPPDLVVPQLPAAPVPERLRAFRTEMPIARLQPGVSREQAIQRLQSLVNTASAARGQATPNTIRLWSVQESLVSGGRPTALLLFGLGMAMLVLIILNLGHLFLARVTGRIPEMSLRVSLGASRWRVMRLLLTESLSLAAAGLVLGLALGAWLSSVIAGRVPLYPTGARNLSLVPMLFDERAVVFSCLVAAAIGLGGGLLPAFRYSKSRALTLARTPGSAVRAIGHRTARTILTAEVAVATVIMVGTLLVGLNAWRFLHQPLGYSIDGLYQVTTSMSQSSVPDPASRIAMKRQLMDALAATAGVRSVASGWPANLEGQIEVNGRPMPALGAAKRVSREYFDTLGIKLLAGRTFTPEETDADAPVAVLDAELAKTLWPSGDPIGRTIVAATKERTVIGIVSNVRVSLVNEGGGLAYVPEAAPRGLSIGLLVSAPGASPAWMSATATQAIQRALPGSRTRVEPVTVQSLFLRQVGEAGFHAPIILTLGALALLVASVGLFGIVSYVVEHRLREFGIRVALGATARDLSGAVVRQSLIPAVIGLGFGLALSVWATQIVRSLVKGVTTPDAVPMILVVLLLLAAAIAAAIRPARRALRVDPVSTLRAE